MDRRLPERIGQEHGLWPQHVSEFDGSVWIINPDLLTGRLARQERLDLAAANRAAVERIELWLGASIDVHQTIGVETVLSTAKYRPLVERAKHRGFEVRLIYVYLRSLELQLERIRVRVAKGGHDVPTDKVAARRLRSFDQMPWFFEHADLAWVFDNSGSEPQLVTRKTADGWTEADTRLLPELWEGILGKKPARRG